MKKVILILLIVFVLSGCAGNRRVTRKVDLRDFVFEPAELHVNAGSEVTLKINNKGALEHNFIIMNAGITVEAPWSDANDVAVFSEHTNLPHGETTEFSFIAPSEPGVYQILCSIPAHLEQGMQAKLIVE